MAFGIVNVGQTAEERNDVLTNEQVGVPGGLATLNANGELTQDLQRAMHVAYEDCLVQKIMPKLRGVEEDSDALDKIEEILRENDFDTLLTDYDRARRKNYGQFIRNSAEYLEQYEEAQPAPDAPQEDGETANPENAEAEQPSPQQ